jgi:hypothetical protein
LEKALKAQMGFLTQIWEFEPIFFESGTQIVR